MSLYDPERDRVRIAGRWLRWSLAWLVLPALIGVFVSANVDVRSLPLFGAERLTAVLFLDGQAYFGHLDDSGESGTLVLRNVYYFQDSRGAPTKLAVGLVRRGTEAHSPSDGMRINRDRVLALESVGLSSDVAQAIAADREIADVVPGPIALNPLTVAGASTLVVQRTAVEQGLQRGYLTAADQIAKLNELVLPVSKAEAQAITTKTLDDLRAVRRSGLSAVASALGMPAVEAEAYVRAADSSLEGRTFANEPGVLLAPDLNAIVSRATQLYAQVGDAAAKQLTQPRATPSATPSASPTPRP